MKEGFVILDEKRHVLTMNNAARAMFCITNDPVGQPMIAVSRDEALLRLLDGQGTECAMQLNGMTIHLSSAMSKRWHGAADARTSPPHRPLKQAAGAILRQRQP